MEVITCRASGNTTHQEIANGRASKFDSYRSVPAPPLACVQQHHGLTWLSSSLIYLQFPCACAGGWRWRGPPLGRSWPGPSCRSTQCGPSAFHLHHGRRTSPWHTQHSNSNTVEVGKLTQADHDMQAMHGESQDSESKTAVQAPHSKYTLHATTHRNMGECRVQSKPSWM